MAVTINPVKAKTVRSPEETAAFEVAFREHWQKVCRLLTRMIGDHAEAEDLALETFWQLYHKPPKDGSNLLGWLYRVATNLGYNALRSRKRRQNYEEQAGHLDLQSTRDVNPAEATEKAEQRALVREALSRMKPRSAQILILRHNDFSYAEIARALQVSPGSVGTLIARAEQEFEQHYQTLDSQDGEGR